MTIKEVCAGKLVDRKSKFYAHLYQIENLTDEDSRNDGEVGSPGRVLLELLQEYNLDGYMIMISRKFGGIKLGQGGVARAFRNSGRGVIKTYIENS